MTTPETGVLSLGLNFALPQHRLPVNEIIASTEATARKLDTHSAQQLREKVKGSLEQYKPPTGPSMAPKHLRAISNLRKDNTIVILPADKGNSTAVMDRKEYTEKIQNMLSDESYRPLKKDPTMKLERTIDTTLKKLEETGEIDPKQRKMITPKKQLLSTAIWAAEDPQATSPTPSHRLIDRFCNIPPCQRAHTNPHPTQRQDRLLHQEFCPLC